MKGLVVLSLVIASLAAIFFPVCKAAGLEGLVLYFPFNEGKGNTVKDLSGNENNGTLKGPKWVDGKFDSALSFDGSDDYVEVPDSPDLDLTDLTEALTLAAWVKTSNVAKQEIVKKLGIGGWGPGAYCLEIDPEGGGKANLPIFELNPQHCVGTSIVADGNWHHLAGTWDGSTRKIYVDGELDISLPSVGKITANEEILCIGAAENQAIPFKGIIDEVKVYNEALSEEEMDELMKPALSVTALADKLSTTWGAIKLKASR